VKKNILVVEDEEFVQELIKDFLEKSEFSVVCSAKISETIYKLNNQKFDLVLLDLKLSGGSGTKIMEQLRNPSNADDKNAKTPIIIMSGYLDPAVVKQVALKVQGVLAKPLNMPELLNKIRMVLSGESLVIKPSAEVKVKGEEFAKFLHDLSNIVTRIDLVFEKLHNRMVELNATDLDRKDLDRIRVAMDQMLSLIQSKKDS
jgi:DNA-binding response OmpR family regulator